MNKDLFSIRDGFGEALVELGSKNPDVVVLTADLADSTRVKDFASKFPDRFFQVGVAEQGLVTIAAGMAEAGKIPFTTSYAVFSPGRTWEQIKVTAALNNVPVKIVGAHAGFGASMYGATHESLEDIALMRVIPNMVVVSPCDYEEARKATFAIAENGKPSYLRLSRPESPILTKSGDKFEVGKANILYEGKNPQVAIIGCGPVLSEALAAASELKNMGIETMVINSHTIKPIDDIAITNAARICGAIVTVEEHQVMGGLGSAVAEVVAQGHIVPIEFIGVKDSFGESARDYNELWQKFCLKKENIIEAVEKVIIRKNA
ncbi:MAG TPA: transketolase C-terminal domain-containing protein [Candidatus Saccharimonadales bacterium]|jgi:transketolase|nr:transketolase C-terminal domain-containing protein [Candidatus Saccharimonadales bacterium]